MSRRVFEPGALWPDTVGQHINAHGGGILFHDGTYFWFGEHKVRGEAGNRAQVGVHVYSSHDLLNWTDEGIALSVSEDRGSEIVKGCILERPKVVYCGATGKFVMWFHLEPAGQGYEGARSGVAVADRVIGPYRYLGSVRPDAGVWPENVPEQAKRPLSPGEDAELGRLELGGAPVPYYPRDRVFRRDFVGGQMARDMTVFVDDDGAAYHVFASENNGTLHISQLADDYLSHRGRYIRVMPGRFHEAPAVMKWRGSYFMITSDCTGWAPNAARLLRAPSIWGPWEELGNPCIGSGAQIANTFESQSTHILKVEGHEDAFIFMADRWRPKDAMDGRYVWLPIIFRHNVPMIAWRDAWSLTPFNSARATL